MFLRTRGGLQRVALCPVELTDKRETQNWLGICVMDLQKILVAMTTVVLAQRSAGDPYFSIEGLVSGGEACVMLLVSLN